MVAGALAETVVLLTSLLDDVLVLVVGPLDDFCASIAGKIGALSHPVRRRALSVLAEAEVIERGELARRLVSDADAPGETAARLEVGLHHVHLPKLEAHQYVEYDPRSGDAVLWEDPDVVKDLLDSA